jgi:hypothetical protein
VFPGAQGDFDQVITALNQDQHLRGPVVMEHGLAEGGAAPNLATSTFAVTVFGDMKVYGTVYQSSDARIKDIVPTAEQEPDVTLKRDDLASILALKITEWRYKDGVPGHSSDRMEVGVIAQELQKVLPDAVKIAGDLKLDAYIDDPDRPGEKTNVIKDFLAVDYSKIFMTNVGATQQLAELIIGLKQEVEALAERMGAVEEDLADLDTRLSQQKRKFGEIDARNDERDQKIARLERQNELRQHITVPAEPTKLCSVAHKEHLDAAVQHLVNSNNARFALAVRGLGGAGKTVLAIRVARHPDVAKRFQDGIYWVRVGQSEKEETEHTVVKDMYAILLGAKPPSRSVRQLQEIKCAVAGKSCLFCFDDVWAAGDVSKLMAAIRSAAPMSKVLLTTRDARLVRHLDACEHPINELAPEAAVAMLKTHAPETVVAKWDAKVAAAIANQCGCLPVLLSVIGRTLAPSGTCNLKKMSAMLKKSLSDVDKKLGSKELLSLFRYQHKSIEACLSVGVAALDAELRARYLKLAAFPEDSVMPFRALQLLWGDTDPDKTRDSINELADKSLLEIERETAGWPALGDAVAQDENPTPIGMTMHNLQHRYLRDRMSDGNHGAALTLATEADAYFSAFLTVTRYRWALKDVADALKADREIALAAVKQYGSALRFAAASLQSDREVVLVAVAQNGSALRYVSDALKSDREIVLAAVQQYGGALKYAVDELQSDKEFMLVAN